MFKSLVAVLALLVSTNAFAQSASVEDEVMGLLVANASSIELHELGEKSEASLVDILASHLSIKGYISGKRGDDVVIGYSSVECKNVTPKGLLGATQYDCTVHLGNGDFQVRSSGLRGPELESSYSLMGIKINKAVAPKAKAQLTSKIVEVAFAG